MPKPIKRGPHSWQVKIRRALPDGTTTNINRTFDRYDEAERFIDQTMGKVAIGERNIGREREFSTDLRSILTRYIETVTPTKKSARNETSIIKMWMRQEWASWPIPNVTAEQIAAWRDRQIAVGKAPSTISNAMNCLSAVFKTARTEWGFTIENPVLGIKRPRPNEGREVHLSQQEEERLLAVCAAGPPYLVWCVKIALGTAMRAGEIRRLEWRHIDVPAGSIHLPRTKNGTRRDVPMIFPSVRRIFEEMRDTLPQRQDGFIFGDPDALRSAGGFTETMLTKSFSDAAACAELHNLRFHDLRHISITRLASFHRDALDLAKTTGHKTLQVLMRYYNELPADRAARLQALARAAEPARPGPPIENVIELKRPR